MFRLAGKLRPKALVLRGNADRTAVQIAVAALNAAERNEHRSSKGKFVGTQKRGNHDVAPRRELSVDLKLHAVAEVVLDKCLVRFGETDLPRQTRVLHRRERRGARAAVEAGNDDHVGMRLRDAGRNRADARFRHELHGNARGGIGALEIVDELRQILDGIDVMVRRRRDERRAGLRVPEAGDKRVHLVAGELSALARLRALRELDLEILR